MEIRDLSGLLEGEASKWMCGRAYGVFVRTQSLG